MALTVDDKRKILKTILGFVPEPLVELEERAAHRFLSYRHIINDLDRAFASFSKLREVELAFQDQDNGLVVSALWRQGIGCYARCFTRSEDGFQSLDAKKIMSRSQLIMHEALMGLRHTFIAHRGKNDLEDGFVIAFQVKGESGSSWKLEPIELLQKGRYMEPVEEVERHILEVLDIAVKRFEHHRAGVERKLNEKFGGTELP